MTELELEQRQYGEFKTSRVIEEVLLQKAVFDLGKMKSVHLGEKFSSMIFSGSLPPFIFSWLKGGPHSSHLPFEMSCSTHALLPLERELIELL